MQIKRKLNNQSLPLNNSHSSETKHQCIKWHENGYKATNQQVQTDIQQHKLNACGNVCYPSSRINLDILGPGGNISESAPPSFVNSEVNISSNIGLVG